MSLSPLRVPHTCSPHRLGGGLAVLALAALALAACDSPASIVTSYCDHNKGQDFEMAYRLLSSTDRGEVTEKQYADFAWDKESFDVRILRASDGCGADVRPLGETEALATLVLSNPLHDRTFECVLPMVKEADGWKITRHWAPMEAYLETIKTARDNFNKEMAAIRTKDDKTYQISAAQALAGYWTAVDQAKNAVMQKAGGKVPRFCHGALNYFGGKDLIYDYLAFQEPEKTEKRPDHIITARARYERIAEILRGGYKPSFSAVQNDVRIDVLDTRAGTGEKGDAPKGQARALIAFAGKIHPPLFWTLYVYDEKGTETHTGTGSSLEIKDDIVEHVPDAPPMNLAFYDFPKMPKGTGKLELEFTDSEEPDEYKLQIPVKPEVLKD